VKYLIALVAMVPLFGCAQPETPAERPAHHAADGTFRNPPGSPEKNSVWRRLPWLLTRPFVDWDDPGPLPAGHILPRPEARGLLARLADRDTVTWIGHMTVLLRLGGVTVLTDPWFTDTAGPLDGLSPRRYAPPGLAIQDMPKIDVVLVSHSHYDHLDLETLDLLPDKAGITAIVPLGLSQYFRDRGFGRVVELDWYQGAEAHGLEITALPVIHWSKRSLFRTNDTLWAGFAIRAPSGARIFFSGDAEYGPVYRQVAKRAGGFDLAILSIGAYLPRVVMTGSHCVPEDCLKIGLDLGADTLLGIHWGTIRLGDDKPMETVRRVRAGAETQGLAPDRLWLMHIGETRVLPRRATDPSS